MKKFFILLVLAAIWGAAAAVLPARAAELEKILTPDQIKNYQGIIKRGTSLYGIKIEKALQEIKADLQNLADSASSTPGTGEDASLTSRQLEKIATPAQIPLFEKIIKIGTALWGVKKDIVDTLRSKASTTPAVISASESVCVTAAIDVKDKALMEKITAAATGLNAAITARSACQQTAIQSADRQRANLEACVKTFQNARKQVNNTARAAQQAIWKTYQASLKACRQTVATGTAATAETAEIMINDGSEGIMNMVTDMVQQ
ncbi:MAG: hypothetical protein WC453_00705 [Patescibacteria group bacterium]